MSEEILSVIMANECPENNINNNFDKKLTKSEENVENLNEIRIDFRRKSSATAGLCYVPKWPEVNLEFQDLVYSVPEIRTGKKVLLRSITGKFRANQLTAILGPSGSGKTTLLNVLAGFKCSEDSGQITVNSRPRDKRVFRKMSRYIMQNEVLNPHLSVRESMKISADLKLGNDLTSAEKDEVINEILDILRLTKSQHTRTHNLSGGEKKRLSIAMELVNNPPVIFLDEPTTGLDDLASSQCISLLKRIAHSGRTIICSVHTPSAKIFEMFDHVYIMAQGQCVYQGAGSNIVPYMQSFGLHCPLTYNPADFIVEVASGEYGAEYHEKMITAVENGRIYEWKPFMNTKDITVNNDDANNPNTSKNSKKTMEIFEEEFDARQLKPRSSWWLQFTILYRRMVLQMWRESAYIKLKFYMSIVLGILVGCLYQGVGDDASKALFNFGFVFTIIIAYMYKPMMPILLQFPTEVQLLKREYFNQWYRLGPYYCALTCSKMPFHILLAIVYLTIVYLISNQPLELNRIVMLYTISFLVALTSDSLGMVIASRLSIVNAMFVGPVATVPLMLLSCYGIGFGKQVYISPFIKFLMSLSYLRHGLEGLVAALYGGNRADTICPDSEIVCVFKKSKFLMEILGFTDVNFFYSLFALIINYIVFTFIAFYLIKRRLSFDRRSYVVITYFKQLLKTHLNFSSTKY